MRQRHTRAKPPAKCLTVPFSIQRAIGTVIESLSQGIFCYSQQFFDRPRSEPREFPWRIAANRGGSINKGSGLILDSQKEGEHGGEVRPLGSRGRCNSI